MELKGKVLITVLAALLIFTISAPVGESAAMSSAPGIYHVYGRVLDQEAKPVANCSVLLIKRFSEKIYSKEGEPEKDEKVQSVVTGEEQVATTDSGGNFSFVFEPLSANDFWLIFMAEGYKKRSVDLNRFTRSRFFQRPNKSPVNVSVVLEKE